MYPKDYYYLKSNGNTRNIKYKILTMGLLEVVKRIKNRKGISIEDSAKRRRQECVDNITKAEIIFGIIAKNYGLNLEFQKVVYQYRRGKKINFAILDYVDNERKIIFELDGKHHKENLEQMLHDSKRDTWLSKERGYVIYRIPNEEVVEKTNKLIQDIYGL